VPELLLFVFLIAGLYAVTAGMRFGHLSVISLFVYAQGVMAAGTLPSLDPSLPADQMHATLIMLTFGTLALVAFVASFVNLGAPTTRKDYSPDVDFSVPSKSVAFWILVSIAVCVGYFASIGYIAFFESLQALAGNTGEDLAGLRLESYAGSRYFFPGYVNQFKNALLPALTIVAIVAAYHFRRSGRGLLAILLIPTTLVFLLGTGQRAAFVIALALATVSAYFIAPRNFKKYAVRVGLIGLALFFITTIASGRAAADLRAASGFGQQIGILFEQLAFRVLGSNQLSSVVGFRYVYDTSIPFGSEWAQGIFGLLPGQTGSDLSNRIFEVLYGSTRGTSPVSLWGAAYHNLGLPGAIILAAVLAMILCAVATRINKSKQTNLIQLVGMAGVTVTLGTWIADGPTSVINNGLVMYMFVWWWGSRIERKKTHKRAPALSASLHRATYS
jgi:oligosaccharide repeat unit polymerase